MDLLSMRLQHRPRAAFPHHKSNKLLWAAVLSIQLEVELAKDGMLLS